MKREEDNTLEKLLAEVIHRAINNANKNEKEADISNVDLEKLISEEMYVK